MKTVTDLKDGVAGILSGIDITQVSDLNGALERAARVVVQKAKIPETQQTQNLSIYSGVYDYLIDTRIYGTSIIDIKPQGISRQINDFVYKKLGDDFDREKNYVINGTQATFAYKNGTPIIKIVSSYTPVKNVLDPMTATTGWTASVITGLTTDASFFYQYPASLRFNLPAGSATGYLEKTITSTDLTQFNGVGVVFLAIEMPNATSITSVGVRIGSDSSNYYYKTNTVSTLGAFVAGEFMLIPFDLASASSTGSPDISKITYLRVYFNYDSTLQKNVRIGNLFVSLPTPMQIIYSSAGIFLVGSTVSTSITTNADYIILNDSAYTIYTFECALACLQNTGGASSDSSIGKIEGILNGSYTRTGKIMTEGLYDMYRGENLSETLRTIGTYYE